MVQPAIVIRYNDDLIVITELPHNRAAMLEKWIAAEERLFSHGKADYEGARVTILCVIAASDNPLRWWPEVQRQLEEHIKQLYPDYPLDASPHESIKGKE